MREKIVPNIYYDNVKKVYIAYFNHGKDENGKYIRKTKTFKNLKSAKIELKKFEIDKAQDTIISSNGTTFLDFARKWLLYKETNCEISTIYGYRIILEKHIFPFIGNKEIQDIDTETINQYIYFKLKSNDELMRLSPNTVRKHFDLLKQIFERAKDVGKIYKNPLDYIVPPKKERQEFDVYDVKQLIVLFEMCRDTDMEIVVKLAGYLGLRREEICGLKWSAINFNNKTITISHVRTYGGVVVEKTPKTKSSRRVLAIPNDIYDLLLKTKKEQIYNQNNLCIQNEYEYVVCKCDGTLQRPNYISDKFKKIVVDANIPYITLHRLRHSFTSIANELGVSIFEISKSLGHSSIKVTSDIYTHMFEETHVGTINAVAEALKIRKK